MKLWVFLILASFPLAVAAGGGDDMPMFQGKQADSPVIVNVDVGSWTAELVGAAVAATVLGAIGLYFRGKKIRRS